ncbi:MAG: hypothetical protein QXE05_09325 [Nitrososphaeria archaeon]
MPHVPLVHILGTAIIIFLVIGAGYYVSNISLTIESDTSEHMLREVTERVSTEVLSLLNVACTINTNTLIYKTITIPSNVNGKGYTIIIQEVEGSSDIRVIAYIDIMPNVKAESQTHISKYGNVYVVDKKGEVSVTFNNKNAILKYDNLMPSGVSQFVVWCNITNGYFIIGFGKIEVAG